MFLKVRRLYPCTIFIKSTILATLDFTISGPIVARSNPKDVITIQDYQFFGFLNLGIGIIIGLVLCFAILLLVRTIKSLSRKKPSKKQN